MPTIKEIPISGFERVIEATDHESGLHCFIAVHNTILGPALGGTRIYPYESSENALHDALRLAKAMTYKSAMAQDGFGGGKSVIMANPNTEKTDKLLMAFGQVVDLLQGKYIAAEDVGTNTQDMLTIRRKTPYVAALPTDKSSGDPSRFTAWGVFRGMQAVAKKLWHSRSLRKKTIAIQGLGNVGSKLANILFWEGADLILCDVDPKQLHDLQILYGAQITSPEKFFQTPCDILAPCAMGGILNDNTIPLLQCQGIAGAANNQLLHHHHGKELLKNNILYAPDYIINAGGIINASMEFEPNGYNPRKARDKVNHIYDTLLQVLTKSINEQRPPNEIADETAEHNLQHHIGKRKHPIIFSDKPQK